MVSFTKLNRGREGVILMRGSERGRKYGCGVVSESWGKRIKWNGQRKIVLKVTFDIRCARK